MAREVSVATRESNQALALAQKDAEISALQTRLIDMQSTISTQIHQAIMKREDELRAAVLRREEEVADAMRKREEEILDAVRRREKEIEDAWKRREQEMREEYEKIFEERWKAEQEGFERMKGEIEERLRLRIVEEGNRPGKWTVYNDVGYMCSAPYF